MAPVTGPSPVDAYLAKQPEPQRAALERVRGLVRRVVPDAEEGIGYGIAVFKLRGKGVVWIAGWKKHCSVYPLTDEFLAAHRDELAPYEHGKGTLRFDPADPPPDALLEELVRSRVVDVEGGT
jgi:uncharacterized protein YdhG (YjbR/CyaY superfamily)